VAVVKSRHPNREYLKIAFGVEFGGGTWFLSERAGRLEWKKTKQIMIGIWLSIFALVLYGDMIFL